MTRLLEIQDTVHQRTAEITSSRKDWPCRKGCDDCCRNLAAVPRVTAEEWRLIAAELVALPSEIADAARRRIQDSVAAVRPIVCPLLDTASGTCLVYQARPIACRAYGFYAERKFVLGCHRIESLAQQSPDVVWGNHAALEEQLRSIGPDRSFAEWLTP